MQYSKLILLLVAGIISLQQSVNALELVIQIDTNGGGSLVNDTLTVTQTGLNSDGVTFDAILTVTGSSNVNQASTGLGVTGNTSLLVDTGEYLQFSIAVQNESGGNVVFNGFQDIDFNSFVDPDTGVLSLDNSIASSGDNFFSTTSGAGNVDISGTSPILFFAIADSGAANSFRIDDVTASFTGTIPEASYYAMIIGITSIILTILFRRK